MSSFYDELCNMLIRPARQTYTDYDLGTFLFIQAPQLWVLWLSDKILPLCRHKTIK